MTEHVEPGPTTEDATDDRFAVFAETRDPGRPLVMTNLSFGRLIDDIVVPHHNGEPFFIDGTSVKADQLRKVKILRQQQDFGSI